MAEKLNELYSWAAGIIDGEGCIGIYNHFNIKSSGKKDIRQRPHFSVSNTDKKIILKIKKLFPLGVIYSRTNGKNKKIIFVYQCYSKESISIILTTVLPWLVSKREQAKLVLKFCKTMSHRFKTNKVSRKTLLLRQNLMKKVKELKYV